MDIDEESRRQPRYPTTLTARMRGRGFAKFDIRLLDLSCTGFRAEAHYALNEHDIIWVTVPGLQSLEAKVAWRHKNIVGAKFTNPLHPAVLGHILGTQIS